MNRLQKGASRRRPLRVGALAVAAGLTLVLGCQQDDVRPLASSPTVEGRLVRVPDKPLPEPQDQTPPPPYVDAPLVSQRMPEEGDFLRAYAGVGRPRIAVFVNRTLEGELAPVAAGRPQIERTDTYQTYGPYGASTHTDTYVRPGDVDEAWARNIDYAAIESALTDWLSADDQATIVSPSAVRARLTPAETSRLEQGRPRALGEAEKDLDADILIQVQARPTRQVSPGSTGVGIRLIAEAFNLKRGESIARAQTTMPPPLDNATINDYTRYLARKLMAGMTATWSSPAAPPPPAAAPAAAPTTAPASSLPPIDSPPERPEAPAATIAPPPAPLIVPPPAPSIPPPPGRASGASAEPAPAPSPSADAPSQAAPVASDAAGGALVVGSPVAAPADAPTTVPSAPSAIDLEHVAPPPPAPAPTPAPAAGRSPGDSDPFSQ